MFEKKYNKYLILNGGVFNTSPYIPKVLTINYSVIATVRDIVKMSHISHDTRMVIEEHPIVENFVMRVCPPTPQQLEHHRNMKDYSVDETTGEIIKKQDITKPYLYFSIMMENLKQVIIFGKQFGLCSKNNWSTLDTLLQNFTPLKQWLGVDLNNDYKIFNIRNNFALNCYYLTQIDLSGLTNLTTIGNNFTYQIDSLTQIDLHGLTNLTTIGRSFAYECKRLTQIDFRGLTNLTIIGGSFATRSDLTQINLSGLTNLLLIGNGFAMECQNLTQIYLGELTNLKIIGDNFAYSCVSLAQIDLSGLTNLSTIREYFALNCSSLTRIIMTNSQKHLSQKMPRNVPIQYIN